MDEEIQALLQADGVDSAKIADQIAQKSGVKTDPPKSDPPKTDPPKTDPPKADPPKADPPKQNVPDPETIRIAMLNEMFGEQFKTVEDVKKANIPGALKELETLRQTNKELSESLAKKPKHAFASDDIAKFNEFARETGIKDAGIFNKINAVDVANMEPMDALVLQHIIENPSLAGKEPQVRKYFETKYNVDSKKVEAGDLTQEELEINLVGVTSDGTKAKAKLNELKSKIRMPEIPAEESKEPNKWTPEVETKHKAVWSKVNEAMIGQFAQLPIRAKGAKDPIVNFALPEDTKKGLMSDAIDYIVSNQMEANEANVTAVATYLYQKIRDTHFEDIIQAVSERVRSMSEEEYLKAYHNPSKKNDDKPDTSGMPESDEAKREKAFKAELER